MEDLIAALGVPGIIIYMLVKDYISYRRNGRPVASPNHDRTKSGDVAYSVPNERFNRLDRSIERQRHGYDDRQQFRHIFGCLRGPHAFRADKDRCQ